MTELVAYDADRLTVAIVGDLHVGSTLGLCPPKVKLDDGGYYVPSKFQVLLWQCWTDYWEQVKRTQDGNPLLVVLNGDLIDGDHHHTTQLFSANLEVQAQGCIDALKPMLDLHPEMICVIRGTEAHGGGAGADEEGIARAIGATKTDEGNHSAWHLRALFGDVRFDVAHHGPLGRLPWTKSNPISSLAVQIELDYYRAGGTPPAFAVRSHNHQSGDTGLNYPVRVVSLPCWQGPTAHVQRIKPGAGPDIGGAIWQIEKGQAAFRLASYSRRTEWMNS